MSMLAWSKCASVNGGHKPSLLWKKRVLISTALVRKSVYRRFGQVADTEIDAIHRYRGSNGVASWWQMLWTALGCRRGKRSSEVDKGTGLVGHNNITSLVHSQLSEAGVFPTGFVRCGSSRTRCAIKAVLLELELR
jgi:hypothetical protein